MNTPFFDFKGHHVFVAGGSSGINLAIADAFAQAGAKLSIASRSAERIAGAVAQLRAHGGEAEGYSADVREASAIEAALQAAHGRFGPIDVLVSGAAGNFVAPALGMSSKGFKTVVDIDLIGGFNVVRAAHAFLRKPGASVLNISAPQAANPTRLQAHVCAAKAGLDMMVRVLAMEWGPDGIRVNSLVPGPIAGTEGMARLASTPEREQAIKSRLALRDYGRIEDIAQTALFLCSDAARYITGSIVDCDGGSVLGDASGDALSAPPARAG